MYKLNFSVEAVLAVVLAVVLTALASPLVAGKAAGNYQWLLLVIAALTCPASAFITYWLVHHKTFSSRPIQRDQMEIVLTSVTLIVALVTVPVVFIISLVSAALAFLVFGGRR